LLLTRITTDTLKVLGAAALVFSAVIYLVSGFAHAATTNAAVAANFTEPAKEIAQLFESKTGHKVQLSFGATGQFYTQITEGAPFQVFLSADQSTPKRLVDEGLAVADSLFTYAVGKLVLFSANATTVIGEQTLRDGKFNKIAIADPVTAPYGTAAVEAMKAMGVYDAKVGKIVQGSNISQTFSSWTRATRNWASLLCHKLLLYEAGRNGLCRPISTAPSARTRFCFGVEPTMKQLRRFLPS
jgi:ABC-type molybdate transport system substrate-binding protein